MVLGVAPIAMTAITAFALTQVSASDDSGKLLRLILATTNYYYNSTNTIHFFPSFLSLAKSVYVSGSVYGPGHPISGTSATPKDVSTDMLSAYKCAKSQPATQSWAGAGTLDGLTFTKGVYVWTGAVSLGADAKVTLNGAVSLSNLYCSSRHFFFAYWFSPFNSTEMSLFSTQLELSQLELDHLLF